MIFYEKKNDYGFLTWIRMISGRARQHLHSSTRHVEQHAWFITRRIMRKPTGTGIISTHSYDMRIYMTCASNGLKIILHRRHLRRHNRVFKKLTTCQIILLYSRQTDVWPVCTLLIRKPTVNRLNVFGRTLSWPGRIGNKWVVIFFVFYSSSYSFSPDPSSHQLTCTLTRVFTQGEPTFILLWFHHDTLIFRSQKTIGY